MKARGPGTDGSQRRSLRVLPELGSAQHDSIYGDADEKLSLATHDRGAGERERETGGLWFLWVL